MTTPITIYDTAGVERLRGSSSGGGGSQSWEIIRVPITFDTPDLVLTGIALGYTPADGDLLFASAFSIMTQWDGTNPRLYVGSDTAANLIAGGGLFGGVFLNIPNSAGAAGAGWDAISTTTSFGGLVADNALPLLAVVDNNNGGDPGSMQGAGEIVLVILKAS